MADPASPDLIQSVGNVIVAVAALGTAAMGFVDALKAFGSIIGKAMRPLKEGQGLIPILIALQ